MTLHLGGDVIVPIKNVIAIFDLGAPQISEVNKEFLEIAEEEGFVKKVSDQEPKTFILVEMGHKAKVFLSPISSSTLFKRRDFTRNISFLSSSLERGGYNEK